MFENKKINLVLSLLLAIGLWIYVVGEVNPTSDQTIKDVPLTIVNMDKLEDRGLAISGVSAEAIEVQVKGTRSNLAKLEKSEVKAILDMSEAVKGENQVSVDVRVPDGIEVINKNINKVAVTIETLKHKKVPVKIQYTGKLSQDHEIKTVSISPTEMTVSGAESLVNVVDSLLGKVESAKIGDKETLNEVTIDPVDKDGKMVNRVTASSDKVAVTSIMYMIKSVELKVPIEKRWSDNIERRVEAPDKVSIIGRADTLKEIQSLTAEPVEIGNVNSGAELPIKISLPEGIELSEKDKQLHLKVIIDQSGEKPFEFSSDDVSIVGQKTGWKYDLESAVKINVIAKGNKDDLQKVDKHAINIVANVSELEEGDSKVHIKATTNINGVSLVVTPENVKIVVTKE